MQMTYRYPPPSENRYLSGFYQIKIPFEASWSETCKALHIASREDGQCIKSRSNVPDQFICSNYRWFFYVTILVLSFIIIRSLEKMWLLSKQRPEHVSPGTVSAQWAFKLYYSARRQLCPKPPITKGLACYSNLGFLSSPGNDWALGIIFSPIK